MNTFNSEEFQTSFFVFPKYFSYVNILCTRFEPLLRIKNFRRKYYGNIHRSDNQLKQTIEYTKVANNINHHSPLLHPIL